MAKTPLILLTASLLLALTFTVSCSENGEDGESSSSQIANGGGNNPSSSSVNIGSSSSATANGGGNFESNGFTKSYVLTNVTNDYFTYIETYEDYHCTEGGNLVEEIDEYPGRINYSISNRVLVWEDEWDDTLHFAGASNNLIGEWTRTKNKNTSCELATREDDIYWDCKSGWDIVKAEFTPSILKITRGFCMTDDIVPNEEWRGWEYEATGCNTFEMYKGADRVYMEFTGTSLSYIEISISATYKGKTCVDSRTLAQQKKACKRAWDEYGSTNSDWNEYYWDFLDSDFEECIKEKGFPEELLKDYNDNSIAAVLAKPLPKNLKAAWKGNVRQNLNASVALRLRSGNGAGW
jgi:hypothetical protein